MNEGHPSSDPRLKIALPVSIEWRDQNGRLFKLRTFTDNISFGGICVVLRERELGASFQIDQTVRIIVNQGKLSTDAKVKHITNLSDGKIRAGLELLEPVFEWLARYKRCNPELLRAVIPTTLSQPERRKK